MQLTKSDMERLAKSGEKFIDPKPGKEFEEKCQKQGINLAEQAIYMLKKKFTDAIREEMAPIYFNDIATGYISRHSEELMDEIRKELLSWTK